MIEPRSTFIEEGSILRILIYLPEIGEEKIRLSLEKHRTQVTLIASGFTMQYKKSISLPCEVRFRKKVFSDGVLEIMLENLSLNPFHNQFESIS